MDTLIATQLVRAARDGDTDKIEQLLKNGADADSRDSKGQTPLEVAIRARNTLLIKFLLDRGADVNVRDSLGTTALMVACSRSSLEVVKLLLDNGSAIDASDSVSGRNALVRASSVGKADLVRLLLEEGADAHAKDSLGYTALDCARNWGKTEVVELLTCWAESQKEVIDPRYPFVFRSPTAQGRVRVSAPDLENLSVLTKLSLMAASRGNSLSDLTAVTLLDENVIKAELNKLMEDGVILMRNGDQLELTDIGHRVWERFNVVSGINKNGHEVTVDLFFNQWFWSQDSSDSAQTEMTGRLPTRVFRETLGNPKIDKLVDLVLERYPTLTRAEFDDGHYEVFMEVTRNGDAVRHVVVPQAAFKLPFPSDLEQSDRNARTSGSRLWCRRWLLPFMIRLRLSRPNAGSEKNLKIRELVLDQATGDIYPLDAIRTLLDAPAQDMRGPIFELPKRWSKTNLRRMLSSDQVQTMASDVPGARIVSWQILSPLEVLISIADSTILADMEMGEGMDDER